MAYDEMYNLAMTEDSIKPEKYIVEGYPPIHKFPPRHPNQQQSPRKHGEMDKIEL